ncbi:MAG: cbb3-type cytochrome c oxidase subunit 3 [Proteobacteria bacterium]|nr:cbb3-type cytochrome c oxidase subunit 3 [Pseudomonadota bacterium]
MKQAVLKNFDLTYLPLTAMAIFVIAFTAYAIWAYSKSNKALFEHAAHIPLNDETETAGEMP